MENYEIKGISKSFNPHPIVSKLVDFLYENPNYLYVSTQIISRLTASTLEDRDQWIDLLFNEARIAGMIVDDKRMEEFRTLVSRFVEKDIAAQGHFRGEFLEYLLYKHGGLSHVADTLAAKRDCYFVDSEKERVGGQQNFDIGFYLQSDTEISVIELWECKFNLGNFLIRGGCRKKLNYISRISQDVANDETVAIGFVTLSVNGERFIDELGVKGYSNICVVDFDHILALLEGEDEVLANVLMA